MQPSPGRKTTPEIAGNLIAPRDVTNAIARVFEVVRMNTVSRAQSGLDGLD
jgi:hypothetical protein